MTTKAVFIDWYNTLARYDPPSESLHGAACRSYGIDVDMQLLRAGIAEADRFYFEENIRSRVDKRLPNEQVELFTKYEDIVLKRAGVAVPQGMALPIWMKMRDMSKGSAFVLYEDAAPALDELKKRSLLVILISNVTHDMGLVLRDLGLAGKVDHVVLPQQAGAEKPDPKIFQFAMDLAKVEAPEVVHVGDQYHVDVVGARSAGIQPILLDRFGVYLEADCVRITSLSQLASVIP
ncbi:MAG: HAD-IA family hydrolase [Chloroflexi bacterium]|nr:HAD-IA family hydrolase [Chloroflexota bacterium]